MLFAQAGGGFGGGQANQGLPPEFLAIFLVFLLIIIVIALVIQIFYLLTLYRCYSQIAPENRRMEPGHVWLNLIPLFGSVWIFFTTIRLADSLRDEFRERRLRAEGDFGRSLGIAYPILSLLGAIPYLGSIFGLAGLVCFIIYWVKIAGYSRQLRQDSLDQLDQVDRAEERAWDEDDQGQFKRADRP